MKIKVLIAEDQRLLRQCFSDALSDEPDIDVVGTASDGNEALILAGEKRPNVVLMDLSMPNLDGVSAAKIFHRRYPKMNVLMLSLHNEPAKVADAMRAGVKGFVSKDVDFDELVKIIRAINAGVKIQSPFLIDQRMDIALDIAQYNLSEREILALKLLAKGLNNAEIAESLCVSEQTTKKDFVDIFERLGVKNRTQAAVKCVQLGLVDD